MTVRIGAGSESMAGLVGRCAVGVGSDGVMAAAASGVFEWAGQS